MLPAVMMAGMAMQAMAQYSSLMDQADSLDQAAGNNIVQMHEIKWRSDKNKDIFKSEATKLMGQQTGLYAASGVDVTRGAPLSVMHKTVNTMVERLNMMERETAFTLMMKDMETESLFKQAGQTKQAANMAMLTGGAKIAGAATQGS